MSSMSTHGASSSRTQIRSTSSSNSGQSREMTPSPSSRASGSRVSIYQSIAHAPCYNNIAHHRPQLEDQEDDNESTKDIDTLSDLSELTESDEGFLKGFREEELNILNNYTRFEDEELEVSCFIPYYGNYEYRTILLADHFDGAVRGKILST